MAAWKHNLGISFCVLAFFLFFLLSLYSFFLFPAAARLDRIESSLRSEGILVELPELSKHFPPSAPEAAARFQRCAGLVEALPSLPLRLEHSAPLRARPPEDAAELGKYVETNASLFDEFCAAASEIKYLPLDWRKGYKLEFTHLSPLSKAAFFQTIRALLDFADGKTESALGHIRKLSAAADFLFDEPALVSCRVAGWIVNIRMNALQSMFAEAPGRFTDSQLRSLIAESGRIEARLARSIRSGFIGEISLSYAAVLNDPASLQLWFMWNDRIPGILLPLYFRTPKGIADKTFYLETMSRFIRYSKNDPCFNRPDPDFFLLEAKDKHYVFSVSTLSCGNIVLERSGSVRGCERIFRTALSVELFRRANGRLPKTLSELVPEYLKNLPRDPFSGNPFRYRTGRVSYECTPDGKNVLSKEFDGFLVYGVGRDLTDHGGLSLLRGSSWNCDDVFVVGCPAGG